MAYKRIRVWDGTEWLQVGSQVPSVVDAYGQSSLALDVNGEGTNSIAFGGGATFGQPPLVFTQVTGSDHALISVTPDTVGFTINVVSGPSDGTIYFDWFAVQANFTP